MVNAVGVPPVTSVAPYVNAAVAVVNTAVAVAMVHQRATSAVDTIFAEAIWGCWPAVALTVAVPAVVTDANVRVTGE